MHCLFFFFNDTATTEIYTSIDTLSLHDALPICKAFRPQGSPLGENGGGPVLRSEEHTSELQSPIDISYAVFCLKKKKTTDASLVPPLGCEVQPMVHSPEAVQSARIGEISVVDDDVL